MSESGGNANVYEALPHVHPEAAVVYCGDPRLQTAFVPFIENELGLAKGQYIPTVVGGGAGALAYPREVAQGIQVHEGPARADPPGLSLGAAGRA